MMKKKSAAKSKRTRYSTEFKQQAALRDAAKIEGGMAGAGVGLGAGNGFGQMKAGAMGAGQAPAQPPADPVGRLAALKKMLDGGLITQADFDEQKKRILSGI